MDRREIVKSLAGLSGAVLLPSVAAVARAQARRPRIAVVGAGIMGASIAYHLAGQGAEVIVLEKAAPGIGATQGAFAMLIATHEGGDRAFNDLYGMAVLDWRRLELELNGAVAVQWGGTASWTAPGQKADELNALTRQLQGWGAPIRAITAEELQRLVPGVVPGPFGAGNFSPDQGTLDPTEALEALIAAGRRRGVQYRFPCEVAALATDGRKLTGLKTTAGPIEADAVVLAAGAAVPDLAGQVGVKAPIDVVSGTLAHSKPFPRVLQRVLNGPDGSLKQDPDGRIVTGADYRPGASGTDVSQAYGERLLALAARTAPALSGARLEKMTLGYVPIPVDSHPIVGFCAAPANLYLALTMSGVTMAPLMGRFAASEILDGIAVEVLKPYRPSRFA
ncbi:MAG TPA: FAD-binding oxidoreductase [Caulobacteraceae bacterium]|jgi:glycine/D-amino acid oxidase-like deaminating enzyme|nr:FAD-binding oxidoreductase [Caulobacteraceae bacterium]